MKTVAITGSSGFVGRNLIKVLEAEDFNIVKLDIQNGFDLTDWEKCKRQNGFDIIVHLAARSFVPDSFIHPQEFYTSNLVTTINALELARINHAKFVFFSSYLYGEPQYLPVDESHPLSPHNPYAQSKLIGENICKGYHRDFQVPVTIFRPFNIYGPEQNKSFLLPTIVEQMKSGKLTLKDPRPKRDFIHVFDIVQAVVAAIKADSNALNTINLGSGKSYSVNEIVDLLVRAYNNKVEVIYSNEYRRGEVMDTVANISQAFSILGWKPSITLEEGLKSLI